MFSRFLFCIAVIFLSSPVAAVPVRWDVSNVYNDHGGFWDDHYWNGYFIYDADIDTLLEINLSSEAAWISHVTPRRQWGQHPDLVQLGLVKSNPFPSYYFYWEHDARLAFSAPLTNDGGRVNLGVSTSYECFARQAPDFFEDYWCDYIEGYIVGTPIGEYQSPAPPIPLPASLPLLIAAFGGLAGLRRLQRGIRA